MTSAFNRILGIQSGKTPTPEDIQWLCVLTHKGLKSRQRKLRYESCVCCQDVLQPQVPVCEVCAHGSCEGKEGHEQAHLVDHYQVLANRM